MAKALKELREQLGRAVGRFHGGAVTAQGTAPTTQFRDTNTLPWKFSANDQIIGSMAYIRYDAGGAGAAPEGEWRYVSDYATAIGEVTVPVAFTAAPAAGDLYELYFAPLALTDWDACINRAIEEAWPEIYELIYKTFYAGAPYYNFTSTVESVERVVMNPSGEQLQDWGTQELLLHRDYEVDGTPGSDLRLALLRHPLPCNAILSVWCRQRYQPLSGASTTDADTGYLLAAAQANWYEMMSGWARGGVDAVDHNAKLGFWREQAEARKQRIVTQAMGLPPIGAGKR